MVDADNGDARKKLVRRVETLLFVSVSGGVLEETWARLRRGEPAIQRTSNPLKVALLPAVMFAIAPYLIGRLPGSQPMPALMFWPVVWALLFIVWGDQIAKLTARRIVNIIDLSVTPDLSPQTCGAIDQALAAHFRPGLVLPVSWAFGLATTLIGGWLMANTLAPDPSQAIPWFQLGWWCFGWSFIFATACRVTWVSSFYAVFAKHLPADDGAIYADDPPHSAAIRAFSGVGRAMLLFWIGVAGIVALLPVFDGLTGSPADVFLNTVSYIAPERTPTPFGGFVVIVAGFMSVGVGSAVFLFSESELRGRLKTGAYETLRAIEAEIRQLSKRPGWPGAATKAHLDALAARHAALIATNSYGSVLRTALGLSIPLIAPIVAALAKKLIELGGAPGS